MIEVFGLPGAGKSTIIKEVKKINPDFKAVEEGPLQMLLLAWGLGVDPKHVMTRMLPMIHARGITWCPAVLIKSPAQVCDIRAHQRGRHGWPLEKLKGGTLICEEIVQRITERRNKWYREIFILDSTHPVEQSAKNLLSIMQ